MFNSNKIRSRVMAQINQRLEEAEIAYLSGCKAIDQQAKEDKEELEDTTVNNILRKFL